MAVIRSLCWWRAGLLRPPADASRYRGTGEAVLVDLANAGSRRRIITFLSAGGLTLLLGAPPAYK